MSRSGPRSGSHDPRRGGGSSRSRDEWDGGWQGQRGGSRGASGGRDAGRERVRSGGRDGARSGGRDGGANRSRGRGESARTTPRRDDRWDDRRDDQHGWDETGNWSAGGGGGGLWGDADQGYSAQAPTPEWPGHGGPRAKGAKNGAAGKQDWKARLRSNVRFWMTRDAWRMSLLRTWPSLLRLMVAVALLGSCGGLAAFMVRAQEGTVGGVGRNRASLASQQVGPGTPTPCLYCDDPFTPPPLPTATPTKTKPTATASAVQFQVALAPTQAQCTGPSSPLPPVTLTLDNSHSRVEVNWTLALGPDPSGVGTWAQAAPATQGTLPAGAAPQAITLTPDASLCTQLMGQGKSGQFTAQVKTTPGGQPSMQIFTVAPFSSGGPTPSPSAAPSPAPSPSVTKTP